MPRPLILDHSIVGQAQTTLTIRKDRNLAACRICGAIFQPQWFITSNDQEFTSNLTKLYEGEVEIIEWRTKHNRKHSDKEHAQLRKSGMTMTPEAAHKLAPFGIAPVADAVLNEESAQAMMEAPRAPKDDVDTTLQRPPRR